MPASLSSDVAFTPTVKAVQSERGSRAAYARVEAQGGFETGVTPELAAFLEGVDTAYLATASAAGQPYAQHRGGPKGFIRPLDDKTVAFIDYGGNRQYVTTGNLRENDQAFLFLMDYENRRRVKLWGHARVVPLDAALLQKLLPEGSHARPEQAILFTVSAWDVNCPQHIPQKLPAGEVAAALRQMQGEVDALKSENARLRELARQSTAPSTK